VDRIPIERGTETDPVIWLDRLAAIFKHTNPQIDDSSKPHPCQSIVSEVSLTRSLVKICQLRFSHVIRPCIP
jgi:hypothetical protein